MKNNYLQVREIIEIENFKIGDTVKSTNSREGFVINILRPLTKFESENKLYLVSGYGVCFFDFDFRDFISHDKSLTSSKIVLIEICHHKIIRR